MLPLYGALGPLGRAYNAAVAASEFLTGLIWAPHSDEVSGNRVDPVSAYDLVPTGAVKGQPRGPLGVSAYFNKANSEFFVNSNFNGGTLDYSLGVTVAFWQMVPTDATAGEGYFGLGAELYYGGPGGMWLTDQNSSAGLLSLTGGDTAGFNSANWAVNVNDGLPHFIVLRYNPATKKVSISVDAATPVVSAAALANHPSFNVTYKNIHFGRGGTFGVPFTGWQSRAGVWNTHKSDAEITALYNEGNSKDYADLDAGELTSLLAFYRMNERSGNRADASGNGNTLTNSNTVLCSLTGPLGVVAHARPSYAETLTNATAVIDTSADFTVLQWFKMTDATPESPNKYCYPWRDASGNKAGLFLESAYAGWHRIYHRQGYGAGQEVGDGAGAVGNSNIEKWLFIAYTYAAGTTTARVKVIGGGNEAWLDDVSALPAFTNLTVGGLGVNDLDQSLGPFGIWTAVLDDATITSIFNEGVAKRHADLTAGELVNLAHYYDMTEVSGNRADSVGTAHLTSNNTVESMVNGGGAMQNSGIRVSQSGGSYLRTAAVSLDLSGGYTLSVWCRPEAHTAGDWQVNTILEKNHTWNYTYPFVLSMNTVDSSNTVYFTASVGNAAAATIQSHTYGWARPWALYRNKWINLVAVYSPLDGTNQLRLYVNGEIAPTLGGVLAGAPYNTVPQEISVGYTTNGFAAQFTGVVDAPLLWTTPFDAAQVAELFNGGRGLFHPDFELA